MFSTYLRVASSWQKCSVSFLLFFQNQAECQQGFGPEVLQPLRLRWIGKLSPSPLKGFWAMRYRNFLFFFYSYKWKQISKTTQLKPLVITSACTSNMSLPNCVAMEMASSRPLLLSPLTGIIHFFVSTWQENMSNFFRKKRGKLPVCGLALDWLSFMQNHDTHDPKESCQKTSISYPKL